MDTKLTLSFWNKLLLTINGIDYKIDIDNYIYLTKNNKTIKTDFKKIKLGTRVFKEIFKQSIHSNIDTTTNFIINFGEYVVKTDIKMIYDINHSIEAYNKHYNIKEGDIVIDIGGYHGLYSIAISRAVGPSGKIYVFEPNPDSFRILKENIQENNIKNIISINKAVYNKSGPFRFFKKKAGSRIVARSFKTNTKDSLITVQAITLSEFIRTNHINKIDFIKMDAEGSEVEITEDIKHIRLAQKPSIAIATYHYRKDLGSDTQVTVEKNLNEIGYKTKTRTGEHKITYAQAKSYNPNN
ncbi:MAG: FkbM family methyltransferase [archaeon]